MSKRDLGEMWLLSPGFVEDSVIYKVSLKEVARLKRATVNEIDKELDRLQVTKVIIDAGCPHIIERLRVRRLVKKLLKRKLPKEERL